MAQESAHWTQHVPVCTLVVCFVLVSCLFGVWLACLAWFMVEMKGRILGRTNVEEFHLDPDVLPPFFGVIEKLFEFLCADMWLTRGDHVADTWCQRKTFQALFGHCDRYNAPISSPNGRRGHDVWGRISTTARPILLVLAWDRHVSKSVQWHVLVL